MELDSLDIPPVLKNMIHHLLTTYGPTKSWNIYENTKGTINVNIRFDNIVSGDHDKVGHGMDDTCVPVSYRRLSTKQMDRNRMRAASWGTHTPDVKKRKMDNISPEIIRKDTDVIYTEYVDTPEKVCVEYKHTTPLRRSSTMTPESLSHHGPKPIDSPLLILEDFTNPMVDTVISRDASPKCIISDIATQTELSTRNSFTQVELKQQNIQTQCAIASKSKFAQTTVRKAVDQHIQVGSGQVVSADVSVQSQVVCADSSFQIGPGIFHHKESATQTHTSQLIDSCAQTLSSINGPYSKNNQEPELLQKKVAPRNTSDSSMAMTIQNTCETVDDQPDDQTTPIVNGSPVTPQTPPDPPDPYAGLAAFINARSDQMFRHCFTFT